MALVTVEVTLFRIDIVWGQMFFGSDDRGDVNRISVLGRGSRTRSKWYTVKGAWSKRVTFQNRETCRDWRRTQRERGLGTDRLKMRREYTVL